MLSLLAAGAMAGCSDDGFDAESLRLKLPPGGDAFPASLSPYTARFTNWTAEFDVDGLRHFAPRTPEDVVLAANWAARNRHVLRARGMGHNWSPLTVSTATDARSPLVLADTTQHLRRVEMTEVDGLPAVRVETGMLMEDLLDFLEARGYGFTAVPAVGAVTVGGVLAINGHGCAIPALGERPVAQQTYGSMSNRVLALTAVAWDPATQAYALRTFRRGDAETGALLTALGRAFITEVTLAVEPDQNLRCVSHLDIPASELFAPPGSGGRSLESFLDAAGRIESIWYPYTERPWLKVWSLAPQRPAGARAVSRPYNYPFSDNLPKVVTDLAQDLINGQPQVAPLFGQITYDVTLAGLTATSGFDLWGSSRNTLLFIKATTLRVHESSYAVLTRRDNVQQVVADFTAEYLRRQAQYRAQGRFPVNMPVEYRVTGLDRAGDVGLPGAQEALLSAIAPRPDRPEWDTVVWLSLLTLPGTPDMYAFFHEMERWMFTRFDGRDAGLRPEWSKGWAYTPTAAWSDADVLGRRIPAFFRAGRGADAGWDRALRQLRTLDPAGIYRNEFLDRLMPDPLAALG